MTHTIRKNAREWQPTLARRRNHYRDPRRRPGDAPARPAQAYGARPAPRSSRPEINGPQGAEPITGTGPADVAGPFFW